MKGLIWTISECGNFTRYEQGFRQEFLLFGRPGQPASVWLRVVVYKIPYRRAPRLACRLFSLKAECVARAKVSCTYKANRLPQSLTAG